MEKVNVLIVGGGVVGCAVAWAASARHDDVFVAEQMPRVGMMTSARNSGVIHSGLYYATGSLKARHCVAGNALTYEFCRKHNVPHRRTGKLIVATSAEEEAELQHLLEKGRANGVEGLRVIGRDEMQQREPHIAGVAALEIPSTGIVSAEDLTKAYARLAVEQGASILAPTRVVALEPHRAGVRATLETDGAREEVDARCVVNSAGLYADEVAALMGNTSWRIYPVRGEYCEVTRAKSHLVNGLVYPLPHADHLSLGLHFTKTLWGTLLLGPTARYIEDKADYERNREPVEEFARRAQHLLPGIRVEDLTPGYSGIRPKLVPPGGKGPADFVITRDAQHPRVIHLVGIESPGLTAAASIAKDVAQMIDDTLQ